MKTLSTRGPIVSLDYLLRLGWTRLAHVNRHEMDGLSSFSTLIDSICVSAAERA